MNNPDETFPSQGPAPVQVEAGLPGPMPGARSALILLLAINLFNYIDRQVLAAVLPKIHVALLPDDPDAKTKLGLLTLAFLVSYMFLAPVFGWLGDRTSRWLLVAVGVILWSLASGGSGLAATFTILLITRCLVGIGEAAYGPVAPTVISDLYPAQVRGRVLSWFYAAIPVGGALGYVLGGVVADSGLGWRWAFILVVPPGLVLGALCYFMREPPRGQADPGSKSPKTITWRDYLILAKTPSYVFNTLGMTAMTFALGGMAAWMPTYIYEREGRFRLTEPVWQKLQNQDASITGLDRFVPGATLAKLQDLKDKEFHPQKAFVDEIKQRLSEQEWKQYREPILDNCCTPSLGEINFIFGIIIVVSGFLATLLGGWTGDMLRPRFGSAYFLVSGTSMMVGFPMILLMLATPFPWAWVFIFLAVFMLFFNTGPTNTILANVTHPAMRSSAFALNILVIHALGDAISPVVMGRIADRASMDTSFTCVSAVILVGGILWLWGSRYLEKDTALAPSRL